MDTLVPTTQTTCTPAALYAAFRKAWPAATRASLLILLAHWALETGFGHACWDWNLANVKHVPGDGHDYYQVRCNEIIGGKTVWLDPPDPGCSFVAFADLDAGAAFYLAELQGRFKAAWAFVLAGDVAGFCHELKLLGYYTADETLYTAGVTRCYHQLDASIPADPTPAPPEDVQHAAGDDPGEPHS